MTSFFGSQIQLFQLANSAYRALHEQNTNTDLGELAAVAFPLITFACLEMIQRIRSITFTRHSRILMVWAELSRCVTRPKRAVIASATLFTIPEGLCSCRRIRFSVLAQTTLN